MALTALQQKAYDKLWGFLDDKGWLVAERMVLIVGHSGAGKLTVANEALRQKGFEVFVMDPLADQFSLVKRIGNTTSTDSTPLAGICYPEVMAECGTLERFLRCQVSGPIIGVICQVPRELWKHGRKVHLGGRNFHQEAVHAFWAASKVPLNLN